MEKNEKVQYAIVMFLSILSYQFSNLTSFTYSTGLYTSFKDIVPWIDMILFILLGLVLLLIALDFIVAGMIPDKII